jgi:uncharacterized protein (UPF0333 family)
MQKPRAQTSVEYLLLIAVAIVFVTVIAYHIKNRLLSG